MLACLIILFYDYLLTLGDEVSSPVNVPNRQAYHYCGRLNAFGVGRNRGVRREHHSPYDIC